MYYQLGLTLSLGCVLVCARGKGRVFGPIGQAISDYDLIEEGDRIVVGVSGGKDSLFLAWALSDILKRSPAKFSLEAVIVDLGEPWPIDPDALQDVCKFLEQLNIPHHVIYSNIAKIVTGYEGNKTECSLCSRLRRGCLYKTAHEMGANKVALAHHLDDAIETLFMNMFYQGRLDCFRPKTYLSRQQIQVIRPLLYLEEKQIDKTARQTGLPVVPAVCTVSGNTSRQSMKELVAQLEMSIPGVKHQLLSVLKALWCDESLVKSCE